MSETYHQVAKCRWCGGRFVQMYGWQWRCETDACFQRCVTEAILHSKPEPDASPYFYLPLPLQVDAETSPHKRTLVYGSVGISKSFGARMACYKFCRRVAGARILLLRNTLDQLTKNHLDFMEAETDILGDCKYVGSYPKHVKFENGSKVFAGYCDDQADIRQHMGPEFDKVVIEEAGHLLPEALAKIPTRDRGSAPARPAMAALKLKGSSLLISNTFGRGWLLLRDFYIDKTPDAEKYPNYEPQHYGSIQGDIEDNPYLDENFRSAGLGGLNKQAYAQMAHGNLGVFEGQFFTDYDPAVHVVRP